MEGIKDDTNLLNQVENIIYPCLLHSLTPEGLDSIDEGIKCISMLLYYNYEKQPISAALWRLFPQLLHVCAGEDGDMEGGYGFESVTQVIGALKCYVSRDPEGMCKQAYDSEKSNL